MAARFSVLCAVRPLTSKKISYTLFCLRLSKPQGHNAAGRKLKNPLTSSGIEPYGINAEVLKILSCSKCVRLSVFGPVNVIRTEKKELWHIHLSVSCSYIIPKVPVLNLGDFMT
jgi:hypothetical protein